MKINKLESSEIKVVAGGVINYQIAGVNFGDVPIAGAFHNDGEQLLAAALIFANNVVGPEFRFRFMGIPKAYIGIVAIGGILLASAITAITFEIINRD